MSNLIQDLRHSIRMFRKAPGFAIVAVLALAFGIGVNSAVFTLLNAIALRPLPVRDANEVVTVYQRIANAKNRNVHGDGSFLSYPEYAAYRDQNRVFSGLAAFANTRLTLAGPQPRTLQGQLVTCNYFQVLAGALTLGRSFSPEECAAPGAGPVVILSHAFWRRQFAGEAGVAGKTVVLNGHTFTIVGVAPEGFRGASFISADVWAPLSAQEQWIRSQKFLNDPILSWLEVAGRLKPEVTLAVTRADLAVIAARLDQQDLPRKTTLYIDRATLMNNPRARGSVVGAGAVVLAAVSLVLLIACANLANLLLARAATRQKEIAVRLALGASRVRLIRQLLTESMLLALSGGALGLGAAWGTMRVLVPALIAKLPEEVHAVALDMNPDARILAYCLLVSFATGAGFGLLPALQASKLDLTPALKDSGALAGGVSRRWLRNALVTAQVAVCLVLLVAAGLLGRGLYAAHAIDPGFEMKDIAVGQFDLNRQGYDEARAALFHREFAELLAGQGGIEQVGYVAPVPLSGSRHGRMVAPEGQDRTRPVSLATVSANYFQLLEIPILRGRAFEEGDTRSNMHVVVVSEATARRLWPGEDAVGKRLRFSDAPGYSEVIGVAKDIHSIGLTDVDETFLYLPVQPNGYRGMALLTRGRAGYAAMAKAIQDGARALDPGVLARTGALADNLEMYQLPARVVATLGLVLGTAGLVLAALGIYGVVSYAVSRRMKEIGIRMSLGAQRRDVTGMILWQAMRPVALGVGIGLACCAAVSRVLSSLLFGVSPLDPLVFAGVSIFLASIALLACYTPALRAARVDPMTALRHE